MHIDNSRANLFRNCPERFRWRYQQNLEKRWDDNTSPFAFGTRIHELLEQHFKGLGGIPYEPYEPHPNETVESEAQSALAAYCAHYPVEPFLVMAVEQVFSIPVPGTCHTYTGKFDAIIRYPNDDIAILEHKSEKRNGLKNLPEAWAARSQVSLYMWAAKQLYGKWPAHILLDVLRRQSDKGQEPPTFYRDCLERTEAQATEAIEDLVYVADRVEALRVSRADSPWPRSTDHCMIGRFQCDYFPLCHIGVTPELIQIKYQKAKEYLTLPNEPTLQS